MKKSIELLEPLKLDKNLEMEKIGFWGGKYKKEKIYFGTKPEYEIPASLSTIGKIEKGIRPGDWTEWSEKGPFTEDEVFKYRSFPNNEDIALKPFTVDPKLYNKRFVVGDFEISVSHKTWSEDWEDSHNENAEYYRYFRRHYEQVDVFANYHGSYNLIGRYKFTYSIQAYKCKPTQSNWFYIKPTEEKPFIGENVLASIEYEHYPFLKEFFDTLGEVKTNNIKIYFQDWYDSNIKGKKLYEYSLAEKDVEWFIRSETKDGVYRPERVTIDRWLITYGDYDFKKNLANDYERKLSKYGVKLVQFRADAHYDITTFFNLANVKIKAPQKVIEKYELTKYVKEEKVVKKIQEDKKKRQQEQELNEHNNKFTLIQHGKVIFEYTDKEDIIEYLEKFIPNAKSLDEIIIESVKPIFKKFKDVNKLYIAYWGRYFKYEMAGEKCEISGEVDDINKKHIDKKTYQEILELYEDELNVNLPERLVEMTYGWPERGGTILGVERKGKSLQVFTEDYDFE